MRTLHPARLADQNYRSSNVRKELSGHPAHVPQRHISAAAQHLHASRLPPPCSPRTAATPCNPPEPEPRRTPAAAQCEARGEARAGRDPVGCPRATWRPPPPPLARHGRRAPARPGPAPLRSAAAPPHHPPSCRGKLTGPGSARGGPPPRSSFAALRITRSCRRRRSPPRAQLRAGGRTESSRRLLAPQPPRPPPEGHGPAAGAPASLTVRCRCCCRRRPSAGKQPAAESVAAAPR